MMGKTLKREQKQADRQARFLKSGILQGMMGAQFDRLRSAVGQCGINLQQVHFTESYSTSYARLDAELIYQEPKKWGQSDNIITIFSIDEIYEQYLEMSERTKHIKNFTWSLNSDATALVGQYYHVKTIKFEGSDVSVRCCFTFEMPVPEEVYGMLQGLGKIVKESYSNYGSHTVVTC